MMKKQNFICATEKIRKAITTQKDGKVILKIPRLFFTLKKYD